MNFGFLKINSKTKKKKTKFLKILSHKTKQNSKFLIGNLISRRIIIEKYEFGITKKKFETILSKNGGEKRKNHYPAKRERVECRVT